MSFKDKVVIVTGASSGIGAAAAVAFSAESAKVVMVGRNESKLAKVAACCNNPLVIIADLAKDDDVQRIMESTITKFGKLDILINNAGMFVTGALVSGDIMPSYDLTMSVNLRATIFLTSLAVPHIIKTKGNIINISSVGGQIALVGPNVTSYNVSKAALNHFTTCAATELAPYNVRVNTVSPGPVATDFLENTGFPGTWEEIKEITALKRVSEAKEIAELILFLASDKAKGVTGANYLMDNGVILKRN